MAVSEQQLKEALLKEKELRRIRRSYFDYVLETEPSLKETKLHKILADKIQAFIERPCPPDRPFDVLLIDMPFQVGKSTWTENALPAWFLGNNPGKDVIIVAYNDDFAGKAGRKNKAKILDRPDLFPNMVQGDIWREDEWSVKYKDGQKSSIKCGSPKTVNGQPAYLMVIGDTCKEITEANSPTFCEYLRDSWMTVMMGRVAPGGKVILAQTRWNLKDMHEVIALTIGYNKVERLHLPLECVDPENDALGRMFGEGICPELGKDKNWVKEFKASILRGNGEMHWENNYQGNPTIAAGAVVKKAWMREFNEAEVNEKGLYVDNVAGERVFCKWPIIAISVDCALKKGDLNDNYSIGVWGKCYDDYYNIDDDTGHFSFPELVEKIRTKYQTLHAHTENVFVFIEGAANGPAAIDVLSSEISSLIEVKPEGGKESRAWACSYVFSTGHVYYNKKAAWYPEYEKEVCAFPNGDRDDRMDQTSQAINRLGPHRAIPEFPTNYKKVWWSQDMLEDYENGNESEQRAMIMAWGYPENKDLEYIIRNAS